MLNIYDYISNSKTYKTFKIDESLFCEYKCFVTETLTGSWTHNNCFVYVVSGKKKWKTRGKDFLLTVGQGLFIKKSAYIAHQYFDEEFCALLIFLPDEFIKSVINKFIQGKKVLEKHNTSGDTIIPLQVDESLSTYFYSVLSYFSKPFSPPEKLLAIKFEELIINILTHQSNREVADYLWQVHSCSKPSIREVMESNFTFNMCLEDYAKLCGRSLSSFKADFCATYNMSPGRWLIKKRVEYGKFLLETTDKSIAEIAFESGFKNQTHFNRIFKEVYNNSPLKHKTSVTMTGEKSF